MMGQSNSPFITALLLFLLNKTNVQCVQQIYFKTIENSLNLTYEPRQHIYPVINLPESCPFIPLTRCRKDDFYWIQFEKTCQPTNLCPNGTRAQCVENKGHNLLKLVLLVCAPTGNCNTGNIYIL